MIEKSVEFIVYPSRLLPRGADVFCIACDTVIEYAAETPVDNEELHEHCYRAHDFRHEMRSIVNQTSDTVARVTVTEDK